MLRRLPPEEDQVALGRELAELAEAMGPTWLLDAPILLPRSRDFPDEWRPDASGAELLLERLLEMAGLGELPFQVDTFTGETRPVLSAWHRTHDSGAAALFAGRQQGTLIFGLDDRQVEDAESLLGVWAHEVAHAFRHVHALGVADSEVEEELTDLTTIALGFGVLTTNNSLRHRRSEDVQGGFIRSSRRTQRYGYLPYQAMAFALGLQVRLRLAWGRDVPIRDIRQALEPAQRETFSDTLNFDDVSVRALVPIRESSWKSVKLPQVPPPQRLPPPIQVSPVERQPADDAEVACPACGFEGALTRGACRECGLQLDEP